MSYNEKVKENLTFSVTQAEALITELNDFYRSCGRSTHIDTSDTFVVGRLPNADIIAVVRLCFEEGEYLLRTMQVRNDMQFKGIGSKTLQHFKDLIQKREIAPIYCMPYAHLEKFYSLIGFKKINAATAPEFLKRRVEKFLFSQPNEKVILMVR